MLWHEFEIDRIRVVANYSDSIIEYSEVMNSAVVENKFQASLFWKRD
jgi:DNA-binding transcriptional regulator of glucitol operon